jgi:hypothetical protein
VRSGKLARIGKEVDLLENGVVSAAGPETSSVAEG